jgi:hypothetical protein
MAKCLQCEAEGSLHGIVFLAVPMQMAERKGTVKIGGVRIGQSDAKQAWDEAYDFNEWINVMLKSVGMTIPAPPRSDSGGKLIRGPVFCMQCQAEHYYLVGDKDPWRLGSYLEACDAWGG